MRGAGFVFVGRQVLLSVGSDAIFIGLVRYHLKLRCCLVIEPKAGKFKPEHLGQLGFCLAAVDGQIKAEHDAPTIGLLLCQSKNKVVLLVDGIALVVVACKSPTVPQALAGAVDQLRRYSNQRHAHHEVEGPQGSEPLFDTCQLLIASSFDEARVGTIGGLFEHFASWKTVAPAQEDAAAADLGVAALSEQQRLVAGLLTPANLLHIARQVNLFIQTGGQIIKLVCRYQQLRAVRKARQGKGAVAEWQDAAARQ